MDKLSAAILKSIMTSGSCFVVVGFLTKMVCLTQSPIDSNFCIQYTTEVYNLLESSGFQISSGLAVVSGFFTFVLSVGKKN